MKLSDIGEAMKLSAAEGWNQTEPDWRFLIETNGNVSLLAKAGNKVIATTTATNYTNNVAWIGMVLVNQRYRKLGVAKSLLAATFEKLRSVTSIKLDATPAGQQVYEKLGFRDEYLVARMTTQSMKNVTKVEGADLVKPVQTKDIAAITALDATSFGAKRNRLIEYLITSYPHKAWLLKRDGNLAGFALGRDGNRYHHIGPVAAASNTDAQILISTASSHLYNQPVVADVLVDRPEMFDWLTQVGFTQQRYFIRMYKGANLFRGDIKNHFLICGPEFG